LKKKAKNKKTAPKKFKIGDHGTIMVDRRIIDIEIVDIDRALQEYRCLPVNAGESRIFWRAANDIRRSYGQ